MKLLIARWQAVVLSIWCDDEVISILEDDAAFLEVIKFAVPHCTLEQLNWADSSKKSN